MPLLSDETALAEKPYTQPSHFTT